MITLVEYMIVAGAENRPPMLDKTIYNSWESRMLLYIKRKKNGRMMLESIENGPFVYPTFEEDGLLPNVYALVNHCQSAKDIRERVKLLMKGTELSYQERECKLYNEFDKFNSVKGLVVLVFLPGDDPIACLNKAMAFMSTIVESPFSSTNNQLKTSSNLRNQATIQDGRVTVQQVQRRQARVVKCYNCQGEGHMARQCIQPKRPRNAAWFKEKLMLAEAHESVKFWMRNSYDSDCDDISSAKAVLMANNSSYGSDVLSEDKANQESKIVKESLTAKLERYKECVKTLEQRFNVDLNSREKLIDSQIDNMIRNSFDKVVKVRTTPDAITKGSWGFEQTNAVFKQEVIPFIKNLRDLFKDFDNGLHNELNEVKTIFQKDHLCSACALGKSKKHTHKPKAEDTIQEKLYLLHMDLCGPTRIQNINGRKYILVIVDDYSRFTWNSVVERQNRTLVEAARTMLILSKALLFLWAEALAIACYTQNRSLIHKRYNKTPYELLHNRKPNLSYLHVFGALCYPTNDSEDLGKLKPKADIGIFIGYAPAKKDYIIYNKRTRTGPQFLTPGTLSLGLMPNPPSPTLVASPVPEVVAPDLADSTVIPFGVEEEFHDIEVAHLDNDPFFGVSILELNSKKSSSMDVISTNVHSVNQPLEHLRKWTKDHPMDNVIGSPSRPVSTRHQLQNKALFCYFDAFLTFVEPKNYKEALKESCWIEAMQEELNEF
ncbi:retrovirus-related pol polyprotein from transposon TNT 1-94 [Tanacetum coccineum]